jgi:hypothetical protein
MTEADWLSAADPRPMLDFLWGSGNVSGRKLRLFAVACCRLLRHLLSDKPYRHAVDVAERFADRLATASDLRAANRDCERVALQGEIEGSPGPMWLAGWFADAYGGARDTSGHPDAPAVAAWAATLPDPREAVELCLPWVTALGVQPAVQAAVLRDVMHAPYRPVYLRASWRRWNDAVVQRMAEAIYEGRRFSADRMGVLADALEEAGCTDPDLLGHLRGPGPHVRGCWGLDAVLGKC